ncbi:MAG: N-acetyltransferase, partial [Pseudomonas aeruginosa]|nr:N-acetyltransferase [Pseudomonas aeruginosa]
MIRPQDCEILQWRSFDDEAAFFASMGRFFASARVRRECGGYPLSDGPYHRWFVLRRQGDTRILGFVSLEQHPDVVRLRDAYLRAEARGRGLFRTLRERVLGHVDQLGLACTTRAPLAC